MRGQFDEDTNLIKVSCKQDSSLLSVLAKSNALVVREPYAEAIQEGKFVPIILLT